MFICFPNLGSRKVRSPEFFPKVGSRIKQEELTGVSIHCNGQIELDRITPLCEELRDIAGSLGWTYHDIDDAGKGLNGVILSPESDLEPIVFLLDSKGRMHSVGDLIAGWSEGDYLCTSVKTQFAGSAEHIWLCGLLRHVQRTYMPKLQVTDEGGFWETGNRQELQRRIDFLDRMISQFGAALEQASMDVALEQVSMDVALDSADPDVIADFIEQVAAKFRHKKSS